MNIIKRFSITDNPFVAGHTYAILPWDIETLETIARFSKIDDTNKVSEKLKAGKIIYTEFNKYMIGN